jgi:hypothetical protein
MLQKKETNNPSGLTGVHITNFFTSSNFNLFLPTLHTVHVPENRIWTKVLASSYFVSCLTWGLQNELDVNENGGKHYRLHAGV